MNSKHGKMIHFPAPIKYSFAGLPAAQAGMFRAPALVFRVSALKVYSSAPVLRASAQMFRASAQVIYFFAPMLRTSARLPAARQNDEVGQGQAGKNYFFAQMYRAPAQMIYSSALNSKPAYAKAPAGRPETLNPKPQTLN